MDKLLVCQVCHSLCNVQTHLSQYLQRYTLQHRCRKLFNFVGANQPPSLASYCSTLKVINNQYSTRQPRPSEQSAKLRVCCGAPCADCKYRVLRPCVSNFGGLSPRVSNFGGAGAPIAPRSDAYALQETITETHTVIFN